MKIKNAIIFLIIIAIVGIATFTALNGVQLGEYEISPVRNAIKQGLDL